MSSPGYLILGGGGHAAALAEILIKQKKSYHKRQVNTEHSDILKHVLKRDENKAVNALIGHYKITDKYFDK